MSAIADLISTIATSFMRIVWKVLVACMHGVKIILYTFVHFVRDLFIPVG